MTYMAGLSDVFGKMSRPAKLTYMAGFSDVFGKMS